MWFGKTFNPEGLDARTRFLVTIAALTVLGPVGEPQLRMTIKNGLAAGATKREIRGSDLADVDVRRRARHAEGAGNRARRLCRDREKDA